MDSTRALTTTSLPGILRTQPLTEESRDEWRHSRCARVIPQPLCQSDATAAVPEWRHRRLTRVIPQSLHDSDARAAVPEWCHSHCAKVTSQPLSVSWHGGKRAQSLRPRLLPPPRRLNCRHKSPLTAGHVVCVCEVNEIGTTGTRPLIIAHLVWL